MRSSLGPISDLFQVIDPPLLAKSARKRGGGSIRIPKIWTRFFKIFRPPSAAISLVKQYFDHIFREMPFENADFFLAPSARLETKTPLVNYPPQARKFRDFELYFTFRNRQYETPNT